MRTTIALVSAVLAVFVAGWLIDDLALGGDLPRGVSIAGVNVSGLDRDEAVEALQGAGLDQRQIELVWNDLSVSRTAAELGVSVDWDDSLADASSRRSGWTRPFRWLGSLITSTTYEVDYTIDTDVLAGYFSTGDDAVFPLDFGRPAIELVNGEFVAVDRAEVPTVRVDELEVQIVVAAAEASQKPRPLPVAVIDVPVGPPTEIDLGVDDLIAAANEFTEEGIRIGVVGAVPTYVADPALLRKWVVFGGTAENPKLTLDEAAIHAWVEHREWGIGADDATVGFWVGNDGSVAIRGSTPGAVCCADDSASRLFDALSTDQSIVRFLPIEPNDVEENIAWADSLGITEVIGEFTTEYKPGQSRVTNIERISELTQGAIIYPDEEFSINDYVGVRTRANGFVDAGVIINGVFNTSVGGGISQYATTLFNAAFFAGLEFGEYQSHSIYISRYPYGREATVSHPHPDLEIINNTPYPILIWPTTTDDSITVRLLSTQWVYGEQTDQVQWKEGVSCTRVQTERTRTWVEDGRTEIDHVQARYRPEGRACDGSSTRPPAPTTSAPSTTVPSTTVSPTTSTPPSTSVPS